MRSTETWENLKKHNIYFNHKNLAVVGVGHADHDAITCAVNYPEPTKRSHWILLPPNQPVSVGAVHYHAQHQRNSVKHLFKSGQYCFSANIRQFGKWH